MRFVRSLFHHISRAILLCKVESSNGLNVHWAMCLCLCVCVTGIVGLHVTIRNMFTINNVPAASYLLVLAAVFMNITHMSFYYDGCVYSHFGTKSQKQIFVLHWLQYGFCTTTFQIGWPHLLRCGAKDTIYPRRYILNDMCAHPFYQCRVSQLSY